MHKLLRLKLNVTFWLKIEPTNNNKLPLLPIAGEGISIEYFLCQLQ